MNSIVHHALKEADDRTNIMQIRRVPGGSINESLFVQTEIRKYFLKYHMDAPKHFFEVEAKGLEKIAKTKTVNVPKVIQYNDSESGSYLLMEWIEGEETAETARKLGEELAYLHQTEGAKHGLSYYSYIGLLSQPNTLTEDWCNYYAENRLKPQISLGIKSGNIKDQRRDKLEQLLTKLDKWIPKEVKPSYLHGDLWGGNWIVGQEGEPYVIDPAFLHGDRHLDIAFTELFGGFSDDFYQSYQNTYPLDAYYKDVKPLYQLYYLLVHINIFGEMYGPPVDSILNKYI